MPTMKTERSGRGFCGWPALETIRGMSSGLTALERASRSLALATPSIRRISIQFSIGK